jgi:hypothetical protein
LVEKSTRQKSIIMCDIVLAAMVTAMATEKGSCVAQETITIHNALKHYGIVLGP